MAGDRSPNCCNSDPLPNNPAHCVFVSAHLSRCNLNCLGHVSYAIPVITSPYSLSVLSESGLQVPLCLTYVHLVRYADDTFVIWTHGKEELHAFHEHLNRQCSSIQFTIEEEKEEQIAFLDVRVTRQGDKMSTAVYQKPTHTDRYLPFSSHHHPRVLTETMRCTRDRALQACDDAHRHQ